MAGGNGWRWSIGTGDYKEPVLGKLDHPEGDADAVAQKLRDVGFDVVKVLDLTKPQLLSALDTFVKDHRGADAVLVYSPVMACRSPDRISCCRPTPISIPRLRWSFAAKRGRLP